MKIKTIILFTGIHLFGCSTKNHEVSNEIYPTQSFKKTLNKYNIQLISDNLANDLFKSSLEQCLKKNYQQALSFQNSYLFVKSKNIIGNIAFYEIKDPGIVDPIKKITYTLFHMPRINYGSACWEDNFSKPIYSKKINNTLIVLSSLENFKFHYPSASIQTTLTNSPQDYVLDEIINIMEGIKSDEDE